MKRFVLSLLILVSCLSAFSQKVYFLYLQSENDQPFFVKMNEKIHSSAASGYLILSGLRDSSYTFTIGFPLNKYPEQKFTVDIKGKDKGFLLKNFGEKGWGLFDLQTLTIQMALPDNKSGRIKTEPRDNISPFTEILSKASNDPSLKERPVAVKMEEAPVIVQSAVLTETVKPASEPTAAKKDSQAVVKSDPVKPKKEPSTVTNKTDPPIAKKDSSSVSKRGESITKQTEQQVVKKETKKEPSPPAIKTELPVVKPDSSSVSKREESVTKQTEQPVTKKETAKTEQEATKPVQPTVVPNEEAPSVKEEIVKKKEEPRVVSSEYKRSNVTKKTESSTSEGLGLMFVDEYADGKKDTIRIVIPNPRNGPAQTNEAPKRDKKFLDISTSDTPTVSASDTKTAAAPIPVKSKITNPNCKTVATEADLSKLQKKMIGEKNDEDMVGEAKKVFKSRCFTTEQLKSLSTVFMTDPGKYKFFDAAYAYVSDTENFQRLSSELKDDYYINRFKAMLR